MAGAVRNDATGGGGARGTRLPRWTRTEILVLIRAKRAIDGQGRRRGPVAAGEEPKWSAVSAHCRRSRVDRGAVQCRKRWSNLTGDYRKIKQWEQGGAATGEPFWEMRSDVRRERRLPGSFDREVYDALEMTPEELAAKAIGDGVDDDEGIEKAAEDEGAVFDSGRAAAAEEGLFSDCGEADEDNDEEDDDEEETEANKIPVPAQAVSILPISVSENPLDSFAGQTFPSGTANGRQQGENPRKDSSSSKGGQKRKHPLEENSKEENFVQHRLIEILERNSRMVATQLETQNINIQLDRDQRKAQVDSLLGVLGKLADALGRIADKI